MISGLGKISSATKFVEFFVDDMLDYAVLQNKEQGFMKHLTCFDIREAVEEILCILESKT